MYAVEFQANVKNGIIEIPEEYREHFIENVHVILLVEGKESTVNIIDTLLEEPLKVKNFAPLKREDVYERERK